MAQQLIMTDGANTKALNPFDVDANPEAWTWLSNAPEREIDNMFYKVAASFRAVQKRAIAAASVPFQILRGEEVVDDSTYWENEMWGDVPGFIPKPKDLIRRISMSLTFTNKAYMLAGTNGLIYKSLNFLVPTTITEVVDPQTGLIKHFERRINNKTEIYQPNDKKLIKIWQLDHTTELLPSKHTAINSIFNSTGSIYFADLFIRNFYERGGVKPHLVALKGAIFQEKKDDIERGWSRFLRNLSRTSAKILNAETMDVKPIGAGVDDLKNNEVYRQAIENIAMGIGMSPSELMSDFDSFATASVDRMRWQRDDIFPHCEQIADDLNIQVFAPLGLRLDFLTETSDAETEDEVARAQSYEIYVGAGIKPSIAAQMVGIELPDGVEYDALDKMAEEKEKKEQEKQQADRDAQLAMQAEKQPKPGQIPAKSIKANDNTAMIALRIPDVIRAEIQSKYPFVDKETLNELHITLVYLGDNRTINLLDVIRAASDLGMYQAPIKGKLQGLARFRNGQDVDPLVMTFDSPQAPGLYTLLCGMLDNYRVPYHKEHGFIPHMTLAYIPADGDMPIDVIEPIEINFSEIHLVNGNAWFPIGLVGYENKTKSAGWQPSLDEFKELDVWRQVALRRFKKGDALDFKYEPHYGGLPEALTAQIAGALAQATNADEIKAAFDVEYAVTETPAPAYKTQVSPEIILLAEAMNNLAAATKAAPPAPVQQPNIYMSPITLTTQMPEAGAPSVTFAPVIQPSEVAVNVTNDVSPTPVTVQNDVTVQPAKVVMPKDKKKDVKLTINRSASTGAITGAKGEIE